MRPITLVLAVCVAAWLAEARGEGGQPTFRSGVELVTIDVVATDLNGKPVHGLKGSDFELFEDGKSQPIKAFEFVDSSMSQRETLLPAGVVSNDVEAGGVFAVVIDELGVQVDDIQQVRRITERFFNETLLPNDHVALVRSGADSGFFLTSDRTLALEAVRASTGRRERTLGINAPGGDNPAVVESEPTIATFGTGENGRDSYRVLFGVVDQLRYVRARRKAVLWFSRGGNLPQSYQESIENGRNVGRDDEVFSKLVNTARAANVAIYTIDPRGLQTPASEVGRDFEPFDTTAVRDLAALTGGRAVLGNNPNATLAKVAAENRSYYLLGYEPATAGNRLKARKIRVTTKVPGVSLLHRAVYVPGADGKAAEPELIRSPLPVRDLPITLAPAAVALDRNKRGVLLPFEVGRDLRDGTIVQYSAVALDPSGKIVSRASGKGSAKNGRVVGDLGLTAESKTYQVRFAAQALDPEVNGLAFATIKIPDGTSKDPECSGFVFEQPGPRAGLRLFTREQPITISTLVSAQQLSGTIALGLGAAGGVPQRVWPATPKPLANGLWGVSLSLKPPLPAGNLEIRVMRDDLLMADSCIAQFVSR